MTTEGTESHEGTLRIARMVATTGDHFFRRQGGRDQAGLIGYNTPTEIIPDVTATAFVNVCDGAPAMLATSVPTGYGASAAEIVSVQSTSV